nr:MFS transporter [Bradyrhizobium elkanii]
MDEIEARTIRKLMWRLLPFLFVCYFVAYLDRVNVGFAKLQMNSALGLSEAAYGFGAGLFFISYFLFEVPSNLALDRFGARLWIARIMLSWGIISALFAFIARSQRPPGSRPNGCSTSSVSCSVSPRRVSFPGSFST